MLASKDLGREEKLPIPTKVNTPRIVILIPAYNEAQTIQATVRDFAQHCPAAILCVIDNNSKDATAEVTRQTFAELNRPGDILLSERRQGKAHAIRRAFSAIDADLYVMVDADSTYSAHDLPKLLAPVANGEADMTVGDRHESGDYRKENKRPFHVFGNGLVTRMINRFFASDLSDILSGYRVFSRRFVKSIPVLSGGFELETELTLHALSLRLNIIEIPVTYRDRPAGSASKLNTFKDGFAILGTILRILRYNRPFAFFTGIATTFVVLGVLIGSIPVTEFLMTGKVLHFPSAILASALVLCGFLSFSVALILDMLARLQAQLFELRVKDLSQIHREN